MISGFALRFRGRFGGAQGPALRVGDPVGRGLVPRRRCGATAAPLGAILLLACSGVASPETQVKESLAGERRLEPFGPEGARVSLDRVRFADVTVSMDGARALVVAMVEADGRARFASGEAALAYVGREAFPMERCARAGWCIADGALPALRDAVGALAAAPRPPGTRILGWQIRAERDRATAGEDYAENAATGEPRRLRRQWELARGRDGWSAVPRP